MTWKRDEEFSTFYLTHRPAVAGYCAGMVRSGHLGDELAQEAFVRLFTRWGRPADPLAYVYRIAHNLAVDHHRRLAFERRNLPELSVGASTEFDHVLLDAVQRLPVRLRDVTLLHYYADLTIPRVATVLRRPEGTVKRELHDARSKLADALKETP